jgi:hypothetical protein
MSNKVLCIKEPNSWGSALLHFLGLDVLLFRHMVVRQLLSRTGKGFLLAWQGRSVDNTLVSEFCVLLMNELCWPNSFFFPDDPLRLLLIPDGLGMNDIDFLAECEKKFRYDGLSCRLLNSLPSITVFDAVRLIERAYCESNTP